MVKNRQHITRICSLSLHNENIDYNHELLYEQCCSCTKLWRLIINNDPLKLRNTFESKYHLACPIARFRVTYDAIKQNYVNGALDATNKFGVQGCNQTYYDKHKFYVLLMLA